MNVTIDVLLISVGVVLLIVSILGRKLDIQWQDLRITTDTLEVWQRAIFAILGVVLGAFGIWLAIMVLPPPPPIPAPPPELSCQIESFEQNRQVKWWTSDPDVFAYEETSAMAYDGSRSFKVIYNKSGTFQFIAAEIDPSQCRFSEYDALTIIVYGDVTLLLKLEDYAGNQVEVSEQRTTKSDRWTLLTFNYEHVRSAIDLKNIKNIFLFPQPGQSSAKGEFFLDDIILVKK